ncbi:MAG: nicotinate phosphoribosyltransferase [Bacteroidales bacterium]
MFQYKDISPLYTDLYQLTMAQAYFLGARHEQPVSFDYFFRKIPFNGGFVVFAGLEELLKMLQQLRFSDKDLEYLHTQHFDDSFLEYLKDFRFEGSIYGMREGEIVFPFEPILRVDATMIEAQLIETLLLNVINFQSLIATKACRIRNSAGERVLSEFGLRRAQSFGGIQGSRAAIIGGFNNTSNVFSGQFYDIPVSGTMAHSFIESFDDELDAFRHYAQTFPDTCVLLVDTYNTLKSGIPNAITIAHELEQKGHRMVGLRLDSGDLAYLSKRARKMLDDNGLHYVKIVVSNQLDEHVIKSLLDQHAPIDIFGVGTSMIIGKPDGAIDGVYKLCQANGVPRLKISDNVQKITLPGKKRVLRYCDADGLFYADCIVTDDENQPERMIHPFEKDKFLSLQGKQYEEVFFCLMKNGKPTEAFQTPFEIQQRVKERIKKLPEEHQRFDFPHIYKVGISEKISDLRKNYISKYQQFN